MLIHKIQPLKTTGILTLKGYVVKRGYLLLASCLISQQTMALAISDCELQKKGIAAEIEGGFSVTSGNSETSSWRGRTAIDYYRDTLRHGIILKLDYAEDDNETSKESYFGSYQLDRKFSEASYAFGLLSYENDRFAGLRDVSIGVLGYGRHFSPHDQGALKVEAGPGYRTAEDSESETIFRGNVEYKWTISESAAFTQKISTEIAELNSISRAETALSAQIYGSLAMKVSFSVTHQSEPAIDDGIQKESTDTKTALTLLYRI